MTNDDVREIDEHLAQLGWRYNVAAERFETVRGGREFDMHDVLVAMPHLSLNDLESYIDQKTGR